MLRVIPANAQSRVIKIGFVNPQTGPLAAFGEPTAFLIEHARKATGGTVDVAGKKLEFQVITRDSQSTGNRAADVTADLILREKVDLLIAGGAPDTTNAVASQAEINEVPCINTACPWQPWFFGRKGDPKIGFNWTYLFCFGVEDIHAAFLDLWSGSETNKVVGGLFANDADGNAWAQGLPPALQKAGFKVVDPGRYQPLTDDFTSSSQLQGRGRGDRDRHHDAAGFRDILESGRATRLPPEDRDHRKGLSVPVAVAAIGDRAEGLSCEVPWSPAFPFKSGLTGQSGSRTRRRIYQDRPDAPPPLSSVCSTRCSKWRSTRSGGQIDRRSAGDPRCDTADQLQFDSGPVNWTSGRNPVKNVSKTPSSQGNGTGRLRASRCGWPSRPMQAGPIFRRSGSSD